MYHIIYGYFFSTNSVKFVSLSSGNTVHSTVSEKKPVYYFYFYPLYEIIIARKFLYLHVSKKLFLCNTWFVLLFAIDSQTLKTRLPNIYITDKADG
jgi:hypothetical protein